MLNQSINRNRLLFILIWLFSSFTISGIYLFDGALYWDTGRLFTQFRDHLHGLNHFAEFPWWFPQSEFGYPAYFASILNTASNTSPVTMAMGGVAWILGRLHIYITHFQPWYVLAFGFITPLIFLLSLESLGRHLLRSQFAGWTVLILAAFSPGVIFATSDIGFLEPLAFSLFFFSSLLSLRQRPDHLRFRIFLLATALLGSATNNASLYWNILAVPIGVLLFLLFPKRSARKLSMRLVSWLGTPRILLIFLVASLSLLPALLALSEGANIVQPKLVDGTRYAYSQLQSGNPLEALVAGLPGFGFDWDQGRRLFSLMPFAENHHTAYYYLGLLILPLVGLFFIYGRPRERSALLVLFAIAFGMVSLSAYSPFFSCLLIWDTPLRSCNHYSDVSFKAGGFILLLFAAGLGVDTLDRRPGLWRIFKLFLAISIAVDVAVYLAWFGHAAGASSFFGLLLLQSAFYFITAHWLGRGERVAKTAFLFVLLFDVATHAFLYVRLIEKAQFRLDSGLTAFTPIEEKESPTGVGMIMSDHPHYYTNRLLMLKPLVQLARAGWDPAGLPSAAIFQVPSGASSSSFSDRWREVAKQTSVLPTRLTYNTREYDLNLDKEANLFIRDGYSPYWRCWVNSQPVPITRDLLNFKSIHLDSGYSHVELRFEPPFLGQAIALAYAQIALWILLSTSTAFGAVFSSHCESREAGRSNPVAEDPAI
jgi:hypothetical protein